MTATKTIGPLDRNDMSYIPATTVKAALLDQLSGLRRLGYNLRSHIDNRVGNALNAGPGDPEGAVL